MAQRSGTPPVKATDIPWGLSGVPPEVERIFHRTAKEHPRRGADQQVPAAAHKIFWLDYVHADGMLLEEVTEDVAAYWAAVSHKRDVPPAPAIGTVKWKRGRVRGLQWAAKALHALHGLFARIQQQIAEPEAEKVVSALRKGVSHLHVIIARETRQVVAVPTQQRSVKGASRPSAGGPASGTPKQAALRHLARYFGDQEWAPWAPTARPDGVFGEIAVWVFEQQRPKHAPPFNVTRDDLAPPLEDERLRRASLPRATGRRQPAFKVRPSSVLDASPESHLQREISRRRVDALRAARLEDDPEKSAHHAAVAELLRAFAERIKTAQTPPPARQRDPVPGQPYDGFRDAARQVRDPTRHPSGRPRKPPKSKKSRPNRPAK